MKSIANVETTLRIELTPQDILQFIKDKELVPADWKFYSFDLQGEGVSQGAILTIKCRQIGHSIPKSK